MESECVIRLTILIWGRLMAATWRHYIHDVSSLWLKPLLWHRQKTGPELKCGPATINLLWPSDARWVSIGSGNGLGKLSHWIFISELLWHWPGRILQRVSKSLLNIMCLKTLLLKLLPHLPVWIELTHLPLVPHLCVSGYGQYWFR